MLLSINGGTIKSINSAVDYLRKCYKKDSKNHDVTLGISDGGTGLTIHYNNDEFNLANDRLSKHAKIRKYSTKSIVWYGIIISPKNESIRSLIKLDYPHIQDDEIDNELKNMQTGLKVPRAGITNFTTYRSTQMPKRNELCFCGSNIKYKFCHGKNKLK